MRFPALFIIISYALLLMSDAVIIVDLEIFSLKSKYAVGKKRCCRWWIVYSIFAVLVLALLSVAIFLPHNSASRDITDIMWMLYVVFIIIFLQSIYSIISLIGRIPKIFKGKSLNTGLWIGAPAVISLLIIVLIGTFKTRYEIKTNHIEVASSKLPAGFDGYKIAQISDLHLGTWGTDTTFVANLVDSVNALQPDLIVFTGDMVNRVAEEAEPFLAPLSRLNAKDGVISIMGNHDYGDYVKWANDTLKAENIARLQEMQKEIGWLSLNNLHRIISNDKGESIVMIGVENWGEPPFSQYGDIKKAYPEHKLKDNNFKILLSHNPEYWNREIAEISNIDLTLSGHTHAMQVKVGDWSPAKYRYDQWRGIYKHTTEDNNNMLLYVNTGAGEVGIPLRVGIKPEISLFTLRSEKK